MRTRVRKMGDDDIYARTDYAPAEDPLLATANSFIDAVLTAPPLSPVVTTLPKPPARSMKRGRTGDDTLAPPPAKDLHLGEVEPISPAPLQVLPPSIQAHLDDAANGMKRILEVLVGRLMPLHGDSIVQVETTLRTHMPHLLAVNGQRDVYKGWDVVELQEKNEPGRLFPLATAGCSLEHVRSAFYTLVHDGHAATLKCASTPLTNPAELVLVNMVYRRSVLQIVYSAALLSAEHLRLLDEMGSIDVSADDMARFEFAFMLATDTPERLVPSCPMRVVGHVKDPNSLFVVQPSRVFSVPRL